VAITSIGARGTGASGTAGTTLAVTVATSAIGIGRVALLQVNGDSHTVNSVTDSTGGNTWELLGTTTGNGHTTSLYMAKVTAELLVGTVITATFAASVTDKVAWLHEFSVGAGMTLAETAAEVANTTGAVNGFGSVAHSGLSSVSRLYIRALGKEANTTTAITPSTSFTAIAGTRSRNNTNAVICRGEFRINTSTGETSNPTLAVSGATANMFFALEETAVTVPGGTQPYYEADYPVRGTGTTGNPTASVTCVAGRLIVAVGTLAGTGSGTLSISSPSLSWTQRVSVADGSTQALVKVWTAWSSGALSGEVVTMTTSGAGSSTLNVGPMGNTDANSPVSSGTGTGTATSATASASVTPAASDSMLIGGGVYWPSATNLTPAASNGVLLEFDSPVGDTHWVQRRTDTTAVGVAQTLSSTLTSGSGLWVMAALEVQPISSGDQTVGPATGIASAGALGSHTVATAVAATGIASAGALGSHTVATAVAATGITSAGALGSHTVTAEGGDQTVTATGIASAGALGSHTVATAVFATGVASAGAVGSHTVATAVSATGITSAGATGTHGTGTTVTATGVASAGDLGSHTVATAVVATGISSAGALGSHVVVVEGGPQTVIATGIASAGVTGTHTVSTVVTATGVGSSGALGAGTVAVYVVAAGASSGALGAGRVDQAVVASGIASAGALGSHTAGEFTEAPEVSYVTLDRNGVYLATLNDGVYASALDGNGRHTAEVDHE
jgi:hypothetical protein